MNWAGQVNIKTTAEIILMREAGRINAKALAAVKELFTVIGPKVAARPGGYTRIIKTGFRLGDNAEMCIIELVDFNELMLKDAKPAKKTTRRSRRSTGKAADAPATEAKAENTDAESSAE